MVSDGYVGETANAETLKEEKAWYMQDLGGDPCDSNRVCEQSV